MLRANPEPLNHSHAGENHSAALGSGHRWMDPIAPALSNATCTPSLNLRLKICQNSWPSILYDIQWLSHQQRIWHDMYLCLICAERRREHERLILCHGTRIRRENDAKTKLDLSENWIERDTKEVRDWLGEPQASTPSHAMGRGPPASSGTSALGLERTPPIVILARSLSVRC